MEISQFFSQWKWRHPAQKPWCCDPHLLASTPLLPEEFVLSKTLRNTFIYFFLGDRFLSQTQDSNFHLLRQCFGKQNHLYQNNHRTLKFVLLQFGGLTQKEKFSSRKKRKKKKPREQDFLLVRPIVTDV